MQLDSVLTSTYAKVAYMLWKVEFVCSWQVMHSNAPMKPCLGVDMGIFRGYSAQQEVISLHAVYAKPCCMINYACFGMHDGVA